MKEQDNNTVTPEVKEVESRIYWDGKLYKNSYRDFTNKEGITVCKELQSQWKNLEFKTLGKDYNLHGIVGEFIEAVPVSTTVAPPEVKERLLYWKGNLVKPKMDEPSWFREYQFGICHGLAENFLCGEYEDHLNSLTGIPVSEVLQKQWKDGEWKTENTDYKLTYWNGVDYSDSFQKLSATRFGQDPTVEQIAIPIKPLQEDKGEVTAEGDLMDYDSNMNGKTFRVVPLERLSEGIHIIPATLHFFKDTKVMLEEIPTALQLSEREHLSGFQKWITERKYKFNGECWYYVCRDDISEDDPLNTTYECDTIDQLYKQYQKSRPTGDKEPKPLSDEGENRGIVLLTALLNGKKLVRDMHSGEDHFQELVCEWSNGKPFFFVSGWGSAAGNPRDRIMSIIETDGEGWQIDNRSFTDQTNKR